MTFTSRFRKFSKNGNQMYCNSYITLTNIEKIDNNIWENLINIFGPNENVVFIVTGFELVESDFPIIYLSLLEKSMEIKLGNFICNFGINKDIFQVWRLENCLNNIKINDIIIPQILEIKEIDNFLPVYHLEF